MQFTTDLHKDNISIDIIIIPWCPMGMPVGQAFVPGMEYTYKYIANFHPSKRSLCKPLVNSQEKCFQVLAYNFEGACITTPGHTTVGMH